MEQTGKIKNIVFDLDGTLLNTIQDLTDSVNYVMQEFGYQIYSTEKIKQYVGNGIRKLIERAIPDGEKNPNFEKAFTMFKSHYQENCMHCTLPYQEIPKLLSVLHANHIGIAIVSNKNQESLQKLCDYYFKNHTNIVIGQQDGVPKKPAPDSVFKAMNQLSGTKENTIYVGDSDVDAKTAVNAGVKAVLVTWGFRDRSFLENYHPYALIDEPMQLLDYI